MLDLVLATIFAAAAPNLTADVRAAIAKGEFARAEQMVEAHRRQHGLTPEGLEALSWLGRAQ